MDVYRSYKSRQIVCGHNVGVSSVEGHTNNPSSNSAEETHNGLPSVAFCMLNMVLCGSNVIAISGGMI